MTSPFCWQPWPNPVSLGPRPKDLHTQVPKSRPLSEKGAELIRKRRIKKVFGSFDKGPFEGKRLCFGSSQNMTHSSPGMCIDRRTNPHSFASPSYSCWTSPSAIFCAAGSNVHVPAKTCPFTIPNKRRPLLDAPQYACKRQTLQM